MAILDRLRDMISRRPAAVASDERFFRPFGDWLGRKSTAGVAVSPTSAMTISAYYAAIRNISEDVGKMPVSVYRPVGKGIERVDDSPVARLLDVSPNPEMSRMTLVEVMTSHALGWGNGYAEIERSGRGVPVALYPIHPALVQVRRNPETAAIEYLVQIPADAGGKEAGRTVVIPARDMVHLKGLGGNGLIGYSVVQFAAESLGTAIAAQEFGGSFFGNGAQFAGILEHPQSMSKEAQERLVQSWEQRHKGSKNAYRIAVLEQGMKWHQTSIPPKDAQYLELRQFLVQDIARWFRIPPHKLGDLTSATFSNIEQLSMQYVGDCLMPWCVRWEQELKRKLLGVESAEFVKWNINALIRGDQAARATYYREQFNIGALSINEIRSSEGLNPIEDGDKHYVPLNMSSVDGDPVEEPDEDDAAPAAGADGEEPEDKVMRALAPVIERAVARVNDKERKAAERGKVNAEFLLDQCAYLEQAVEPAIHTARHLLGASPFAAIAAMKAVQEYAKAHYSAPHKLDDLAMADAVASRIRAALR